MTNPLFKAAFVATAGSWPRGGGEDIVTVLEHVCATHMDLNENKLVGFKMNPLKMTSILLEYFKKHHYPQYRVVQNLPGMHCS